ncbi:MAG: hypothetical protein CMJ32_08970 [Phycisphaerae bacterium]|nr:hypothetical protein [Phycisphaerae bacterium]
MNQASRCIRLRRPPVVHVQEGVHVPEDVSVDQVDERWEQLCLVNPRQFDGTILHVLSVTRNGCGGAVIHAIPCAWRYYAVSLAGLDTGVWPLGVKGYAMYEGSFLMGLRSGAVAGYPGTWEFAPGGGLQPGCDPAEMVLCELEEEVGSCASGPVSSVAIIRDPIVKTWEIIHRFQLEKPPGAQVTGWEYDRLEMVVPGEEPHPRSWITEQMIKLRDAGGPEVAQPGC